MDITGGEHEHHAGAYHHQQQVPAHGDDAAYAAMNADLMAPKACRWVAIADQRFTIRVCCLHGLSCNKVLALHPLSCNWENLLFPPPKFTHPAASRDGRFNCRCLPRSGLTLIECMCRMRHEQRRSAVRQLACLLIDQRKSQAHREVNPACAGCATSRSR